MIIDNVFLFLGKENCNILFSRQYCRYSRSLILFVSFSVIFDRFFNRKWTTGQKSFVNNNKKGLSKKLINFKFFLVREETSKVLNFVWIFISSRRKGIFDIQGRFNGEYTLYMSSSNNNGVNKFDFLVPDFFFLYFL